LIDDRVSANVSRLVVASVYLLTAWPLFVFTMRHYLPVIDNDEVGYFLQIKTFVAHGFNGGNFFLNDQLPASRIHFGLHGPAFITIYGLLAWIVGWRNESAYIANLLIFLPSWFFLLTTLGRDPARRIAVSLFALAHGYFFLFLPSVMQESFQISVAILMAALWTIASERRSAWAWTGLFGLTGIAMLTRYTWGLALPMFFYSWLRQRIPSQSGRAFFQIGLGLISMLAGATLMYAARQLWMFWAEPAFAEAQGLSLHSIPAILANVRALFSFHTEGAFERFPLYIRASGWVLFVIFAAVATFARTARNREAAAYSFLLLAVPMAALATYYMVDGYRDFRVLAGFHALAGLSFLARADLDWAAMRPTIRATAAVAVAAAIAINVLLVSEAARSRYQLEWQRAEGREVDLAAARLFATIGGHMQFVPADSNYCKTVYGPIDVLDDPRLIHLPQGFAFSVIMPTQPDTLPTLKGKYALFHSTPSRMKTLIDASPEWRLLGSFDRYALYRSTSSCPDWPSAALR
jgi:hypothetical protein